MPPSVCTYGKWVMFTFIGSCHFVFIYFYFYHLVLKKRHALFLQLVSAVTLVSKAGLLNEPHLPACRGLFFPGIVYKMHTSSRTHIRMPPACHLHTRFYCEMQMFTYKALEFSSVPPGDKLNSPHTGHCNSK